MITRGLELPSVVYESAEKYNVPLLRTQEATSSFISSMISILNVELAPRITRHGVLVEVYGEGILLLGEVELERVRPPLSWSKEAIGLLRMML